MRHRNIEMKPYSAQEYRERYYTKEAELNEFDKVVKEFNESAEDSARHRHMSFHLKLKRPEEQYGISESQIKDLNDLVKDDYYITIEDNVFHGGGKHRTVVTYIPKTLYKEYIEYEQSEYEKRHRIDPPRRSRIL